MSVRRKMLPKKVRPKGLYLYCKKHDRWYQNDNEVKCNCALKYKAKLHITGTKRGCRVHYINADSVEVAIQLFQQFKLEMKANDFQRVDFRPKVNKPIFVIDCIDDFMNYKRGKDVPAHEKIELSSKHLRNLELCCEYLIYALSDNNIDVKVFKFESFNSTIVGYISQYIAKIVNANKTYNNYMATMQSFAKYIYEKYYTELENPFKKIKKFKRKKDVKTISKTEFMKLIYVVNQKNGWGTIKNKKGLKRKYFYRDWLIDAFFLGLFAGGRNEETVKMKWSDIKINEEGQMSMIEIIDYKITRLEKNSGIENIPVTKIVEITPEFENMLREMGYEEKKDSNEYILAPNAEMSRKTMQSFVSYAFTHFYSLLNLPTKKNFKHLRKTYVTNCYVQTEDVREFLIKTGHAKLDTPLNHYIDMRVVMEVRRKKLYELRKSNEQNDQNNNDSSLDNTIVPPE